MGDEHDELSHARDLVARAAADPVSVVADVAAVIAVASAEGNLETLAVGLRARGLAEAALYDLGAATASLERARQVAASHGGRTLVGEVEMTYAGVLAWAGRNWEAADAIERALQSLDSVERARALVQRGTMRYRVGDLRGGLDDLDASYPVLEAAGDLHWLARLHNNRGLVLGFLGRHADAERELQESLRCHREIGEDNGAAEALQNLGWVASVRGDIPEALACFDEAEDLFERLHYPRAELWADRCDALASAHLVDEALTLALAAVAELRTADHPTALAEALLRLAGAARLAGRHEDALQAAREARGLLAGQERDAWVAYADFLALQARFELGDVGRLGESDIADVADALLASGFEQQALHARLLAGKLAIARGDLDRGASHLERAASARHAGPVELRVQAWLAEALLREAVGDPRGVDRAARAGLAVVDDHQSMIGASDARVAVAGHAAELARLGLELAASSSDRRRLFAWMERTRAGALRFAPARPPDDASLAEALADLRDVEARLREGDRDPADVARLQARRVGAQERIRRMSLRRVGAGAGAPAAPRAGDVLEQLGDRVMVELGRVGSSLEALVLGGGRVVRHSLGDPRRVTSLLDGLRFAVRRITAGAASDASLDAARLSVSAAVDELDALLVAPLRLGGSEVVIVPPPDLHALPWRLLPTLSGAPLTVVPSAALWLGRQVTRPNGTVVLAAGPMLEEADSEIRMLHAVYPSARAMSSADSTVERVLQMMDGAALAHIASHGRVRADNPLFSSLELADGPLTVYDIERLGRVPRTMVLSACDAGLPSERPGNEIMGLVAALLAAGARTVIASTGLVPDTTSILGFMEDFHSRLAGGEAPAAALAAAQHGVDPLSTHGLAASSFVCFGRS